MSLMIEEIRLSSFKGFRDFTLECSPMTCLVGLNSRGKTSILQAVRLLHDILVFSFGHRDTPDFSNLRWQSNPSEVISRLASGDPDAIWLQKKTSEPCRIACKYSGGLAVTLDITGRNQYLLDISSDGKSYREQIKDPSVQKFITELHSLRPVYIPPVGAVSPAENLLHYPQLMEQSNMGRETECWRSRLYWLRNDGNKSTFDDLVQHVQQYLPQAKLLEPRLTHDQPPKVLLEFEEDGVKFDISTSGGGLRSLLNLAAVLQFSKSRCILCDEPDSHLHGSLQRAIARMLCDFSAEQNCQVFVATHAPDFIAEIPIQNIAWIDREAERAQRCTQLGAVLADLGTVTKADAVRACGADKLFLLEGSVDRAVLERLFGLAGTRNPLADRHVIVAALPDGRGDVVHLRSFRKLLRESFKLEVAIASLTDNDYDLNELGESDAAGDDLLRLSISRKEVENYFLEPMVIGRAIAELLERRNERTGGDATPPTAEAVRARINAIMEEPGIKDVVRWQLRPRYRETLDPKLDRSTREARAEAWFEEQWHDETWRDRNCPGKAVLKRLREWCQEKFAVTLTTSALIAALQECPPEIRKLAMDLERFFYRPASGE